MKTLPYLFLMCAVALVSCAELKVTSSTGSQLRATNGGAKQHIGKLTVDGIVLENYSTDGVEGFKAALKTVNTMWANYLIAEGLKFVADQYYSLEGAKVSAASAAELEKLRNAKSVADAQAQLEILKATPIETVPVTTAVLP